MKKYLLFDLDGTLTDPKVGITTCVQYALKDFGIDEPDLDKLEPFIGPPLKDSFMEFYHMTEEQADHAIEKYRERFRDVGLFENELYGGIHDLLRTMKSAGMHMAVVSSKPTVFVERILKHFKLDGYFEVVLGSELDGTRVKKVQVMAEVLRKFYGDKPTIPDEVYMIGDRKFDIEAARTFHVESIGVAYGYGSIEELKEAKADYIVKSVAELKKLLMREVDEKRRMDEVHNAQQPGGKKPQNQGMKVLWRIVLPYILFLLMKAAAGMFMGTVLRLIAENTSLKDLLLIEEVEEQTISLTGLAGVIVQMFSFITAGLLILRYARPFIRQAAEESHLTHLKKEPVQNFVMLGALTVGLAVGMEAFFNWLGLSVAAQSYQSVHGTPYDVPIVLGLISFCVITPVVEEMMFRGIVYNGAKKFMTPMMALLMSALFYAYYYGYQSNMIYAVVLGILLAYVYDYFGDFRVIVAVHALSNLVTYLLNYTFLSQAKFLAGGSRESAITSVACLVVAGVSFFLLKRQKKIF